MKRVSVKEIGRRVREQRERLKMTGEALAQKIGTDKGTVSRIERGLAGVDTDRLQSIAAALSLDARDLLAPIDPRPPRGDHATPRRAAARDVSRST